MGHYYTRLGHMLKNNGDTSHKHIHEREHCHSLLTGHCRMHLGDGTWQDYTAPALMHVDTGVEHWFEARSDDVSYICFIPSEKVVKAK